MNHPSMLSNGTVKVVVNSLVDFNVQCFNKIKVDLFMLTFLVNFSNDSSTSFRSFRDLSWASTGCLHPQIHRGDGTRHGPLISQQICWRNYLMPHAFFNDRSGIHLRNCVKTRNLLTQSKNRGVMRHYKWDISTKDTFTQSWHTMNLFAV